MSSNQTDRLVLGFATNLNAERLEVFAKTLRNVYSAKECDLVICTNKVNEKLCEISKKYFIDFVYTPSTYSYEVNKFSKLLNRIIIYPTKWLATLTKHKNSLNIIFPEMYVQLLKLWHHPHFVRWLSYRDFFMVNRQYKKIFISDIKDVAFQSPFFEEELSGLHFFKQDVQYGGDDYWDTSWYRDSYGVKELEKVISKSVLCIGTIMGDFNAVESFIEILCQEILKTPFVGIEQSIFNHLFYTEQFNNIPLKIHENAIGSVLTLTGGSWNRFEVSSNGVFSTEGKLIPVVHMYDRHEETFNYFSELLGYQLSDQGIVKGK